MCRLIVVLQEKTYVYDTNSLAILDTIDTVPNLKGEWISCFYSLTELTILFYQHAFHILFCCLLNLSTNGRISCLNCGMPSYFRLYDSAWILICTFL